MHHKVKALAKASISGPAADVEPREQRRAGGHEQRDGEQQRDGEGDQLVEPVFSVFLPQRAHDLRHEHRVEDAAGDQREHHLGDHRSGLVRIGCQARRADGRGEQDRAYLAGKAGGCGSARHDQ
jgi:hypothetical protein